MSNKIEDFCKKCNKNTIKRLVRDKNGSYYSCTICLENNCRIHRKKKWESYLAQKANARKRTGSVKLTGEDLKKLNQQQNNRCAISGIEFDIQSKWYRPSLDRIDNSKGYTLDNIQLVTWIVNHTRGELSIDEYISVCIDVAAMKKIH